MAKGIIIIDEDAMATGDIARIEAEGEYMVIQIRAGRRAEVLTWLTNATDGVEEL